MAFRSLENALFLGKRWGSTDRLCQNVAFRSLENASFLGKSGGQQIDCAKLWLSEAWMMLYFLGKMGVDRWAVPKSGFPKPGKCFISREKWGSTDKLPRFFSRILGFFRASKAGNAIFLEKYSPAKIFVEISSLFWPSKSENTIFLDKKKNAHAVSDPGSV